MLGSQQIARIIGRGGCNVNKIRDCTQTHIDIEKPKRTGSDRAVTIRGTEDMQSFKKSHNTFQFNKLFF